MLVEIIKIGVTENGKDVPVGETRETDEASAKALAADGYVKIVAENAFKDPITNSEGGQDELPGTGEQNAAGGQQLNEGVINDVVDNSTEMIKKALDNQYKRDDLYEAAKAAGVEIAYDAKKADIVDAVVAQGKADVVLK